MLAGMLGIVGLGLAVMVIGALMESNLRKAAIWGAAFLGCIVVILTTTSPKPFAHVTECYTDWDGRSNSSVCD